MFHRTMVTFAMVLSIPLFAEAQLKPIITKPAAEEAALAAVKGGKILSGEYEKENGKHIWSFHVRADGTIKGVRINPVSGMVLKFQNESMANEKQENAEEANEEGSNNHGHSKTVGQN